MKEDCFNLTKFRNPSFMKNNSLFLIDVYFNRIDWNHEKNISNGGEVF